MTTYKHDARLLSTTDGTTISTGSASPGAPDTFTASLGGGGGAAVTFRNSGGNLTGKHWHFSVTGAVNARGDRNVTSTPRMAWMAMLDVGTGGVDNVIMNFTTAAGLRIVHAGATNRIQLWSQSNAFVWETTGAVTGRVKIFIGAEIGASTNDGEIHVKVYAGGDVDSATPTYTYDTSTGAAGTANFTQFRFGKVGSGGVTGLRVQWISGSDTQYTETGLDLSNAAPIANAGADQTNIEPWSTVSLSGLASTDDVAVTGYSWTQLSGATVTINNANTATPNFEAPATIAGDTSVFQLSVTDANSGVGTDTVSVTTLPVTERALIGGVIVPMRIRNTSPTGLENLRSYLTASVTDPVPVVFAGSSTTFGNNASDSSKRYVNQLVESLQGVYPSGLGAETSVPHSTTATFTSRTVDGIHGYNAGRGATTSADYLTSTHRTNIAALNPKIIFHLLGANDYGTNVPPATFKANLSASVEDLKTKLTVPCVQVLIRGHQRQDITGTYPWADYGTAMAEIAAADPGKVVYVDLTPDFVAAGIPGADSSNYLDTDNLHLTDAGHTYLADKLWAALFTGGTRTSAPLTLGSTLLTDTFTRANSTTSPGTATSGQVWSVDSGTWGINTNQLYNVTAPGNAFIDAGSANVDVSCTFLFGNTGGLLFRYADINNRWGLFLDNVNKRVQLYKTAVGINAVMAETADNAVVSATTYTLRVTVFGDLIICYINGVETLRYTMTEAEFNASQARTAVGFRQSVTSASSRFDDLVVKALDR